MTSSKSEQRWLRRAMGWLVLLLLGVGLGVGAGAGGPGPRASTATVEAPAPAGAAKTGLGNPTVWPPTDNPSRVDPRKRFLMNYPPPFRFWCTSVDHVPIECVRQPPPGPREKCSIPPNKLKLTCFSQEWSDTAPPPSPPD